MRQILKCQNKIKYYIIFNTLSNLIFLKSIKLIKLHIIPRYIPTVHS